MRSTPPKLTGNLVEQQDIQPERMMQAASYKRVHGHAVEYKLRVG